MMCDVTVSGFRTDYFPYRWSASAECLKCGPLHHVAGSGLFRGRQERLYENAWKQVCKVADNHETYPFP
jgi:hypothetical protein